MEELGGALTHNTRSGVAHYLAEDEDDAIDYVRTLLSFLPDNNMAELPVYETEFEFETTDADRALNTLIPDSPNQPYDIHEVLRTIVDAGDFLEVQPLFAPNIVIGFGRIEGRTVGIIANQPSQMAGTLNIDAARRPRASSASATRSRCRSSPSSTFRAISRHRSGMDGRHPARRKAPLRVRRGDGSPRHGHPPQGLRRRVHRDGIQAARRRRQPRVADRGDRRHGRPGSRQHPLPRRAQRAADAGEDVAAVRTRLANEYTYNVASPFLAAERGELDGIIEPAQTRVAVAKALRALRGKRASLPPKKHGNIPL